ncbi:MAG: GHKL domain-containing protein [Planctomycetaceae bacterium]|nr:GHKL domain-containing protein [Planctomycetaceae bacterium]
MKNDAVVCSQFEEYRLNELFRHQQMLISRQTDQMFAGLMVLQWIAGILMALILSPRTWIGDTSSLHIHIWAAVFLGGAVSSLPIWLAIHRPGQAVTRHAVAFGQMLWSALLIHFSGGRIESHFHVFGSLAFLAFYQDYRVLVTASLVIAVDHFLRGVWWPQSVFGVLVESPFRWIEHTAWVLFEDCFLFYSCLQNGRLLRENCRRQTLLESTNRRIEVQVTERTHQLQSEKERTESVYLSLAAKAEQLSASNSMLADQIAERTRAEKAQAALQERYIESSRIAGMAEVATGVLHNVGNVLNSVNVSANLLIERSKRSEIAILAKASAVIDQHCGELPKFLTEDIRGRNFPRLLHELSKQLSRHEEQQVRELENLTRHIDHIKQVISMQQTYAHLQGHTEPVRISDLLDDALKIKESGLIRHNIHVIRTTVDDVTIVTDKHKVLQILVNLISNAKHAVIATSREYKEVVLTVTAEIECVSISVQDNGQGIPAENLTNIFCHGFTTRAGGHGFGLHSAALAAQQLKGSLSVCSDGPDCGATFTLILPRGRIQNV